MFLNLRVDVLVRFTPAEIQVGREHLHRQCVQFNDASIDRFMQQVFASDELVQAFIHPRLVKPGLLMGAWQHERYGRTGHCPVGKGSALRVQRPSRLPI